MDATDIDAVVIGTWPNLHCGATVAAHQTGKHVLCEARMSRNLAEARQMVEAARFNPGLSPSSFPARMA